MKKLIAIVLICLLAMPAAVFASDGGASGPDQYRLLYDLGVMPETEEQTTNLTRGEFAAYVARLSGVDVSALRRQVFGDVGPDYEYFDEIAAVKGLGLAAGDASGNFLPNDNICYQDAVGMLMKLLGYYEYAQKRGGTEAVAAKIGLTKNVPSGGGYLNVKQYAALVTNAVKIDVMTESTAGEYDVQKDNTLLEAYLGLSKIQGQVTACGYTALNGESQLADDAFTLSGKDGDYLLRSNTLSKDEIFELLGLEADVYYRTEEEDRVAVSVVARSSTEVLVIGSKSLDTGATTKTRVSYYDETGKIEKATVSKSAYVLYNKAAAMGYTDGDFKIVDGKIKLVDTDGNGVYDIVIITEYGYTLVRSVNSGAESIFDQYNLLNIELKDQDVQVTENGAPLELQEIKTGDLIVSERDKSGRFTSVRRVMDRVAGTVDELSTDGCSVDGEYYSYSEFYKQLMNQDEKPQSFEAPEVGGVICFLLDENGAVAAAVPVSAQEGMQYGFLIALSKAEGISKAMRARMLTDSGSVKIFSFKDRLVADGDPLDESKLMNYFATRFGAAETGNVQEIGKVVKFMVNADGVISRIDTEYFNAKKENQNSSLHNDIAWNDIMWSGDANSFSGYVLRGSRTTLFAVPETMSGDDKSYGLLSTASLVSGQTYKISAYNMARSGEADVICIKKDVDAPSTINTWDPPYLIEKITNVMNSEEEIVQKATAYSLSGKTELVCEKAGMLDGYQAGDVIRCGFNMKNAVNNVEKVLTRSTMKTPFMSHSNFTYSYWFYYGKVVSVEGNIVCVSLNADDTDLRYFDLSQPLTNRSHYVFDCLHGKIKTMDMSDLIGAESSNNPSWVLMYAWKGQVKDVLAFNNVE